MLKTTGKILAEPLDSMSALSFILALIRGIYA
jgi:hypothetical protein